MRKGQEIIVCDVASLKKIFHPLIEKLAFNFAVTIASLL